MAVSNELMLAILAMDAYNRGYDAGVVVGGNQLGTALLGRGTNEQEEPEAVTASFFAQAYTLADGRTVISYRGTDRGFWAPEPNGDIRNGYVLAAGLPDATQALAAAEFSAQYPSQRARDRRRAAP